MDYTTYERLGRAEYADLAETVASILAAAARTDHHLRLQHVQHRAKDPASLKRKLENRKILDTKSLEVQIKDLAGCRIIFYTNADVDRFLTSGIIRDNFEIDFERTKIHYPRPDSDKASELFISINYVVKLAEDRSKLPEYVRFRDMWCEVQVQTTLHHAWAEMAHDTIYKKPELKEFGSNLLESIERRMAGIMRKFLLPAGYEFQKVVDDFERLSAGKEIFDQGALEALALCDNNNARYDLLNRFREHVLPYYDDLRSMYPQIRECLISTVHDARGTQARPIETPFGAFAGHSLDDVVAAAANILDNLRYFDVEATFDAICQLFVDANTDGERKRLVQSAELLSAHNLDVWKEAGPLVQSVLVDRIRALDEALLRALRPVLLTVLEQVLRPNVSGASSTYASVTFRRGAVLMSEALARARNEAIAVLTSLHRYAETDVERRAVMDTLLVATTTPHGGAFSNELLGAILENAHTIVEFYSQIADCQSYEILQHLEHKFLFLYRRNQSLPAESTDDPGIVRIRNKLNERILAFRNRINMNREFCVYKVLVGFESVFPPAWEDPDFGYREEKRYREHEITRLVAEVTTANAEEWSLILRRCAQTQSNDMAAFPSFALFLETLGQAKPEIILGYLEHEDALVDRFVPSMLIGLSRSERKEDALRKALEWIETGRYLGQVAWYLRLKEEVDHNLLQNTFDAAMKKNDDEALLTILYVLAIHQKGRASDVLGAYFMPIVGRFVAKEDTRWIDATYHSLSEASIVDGLCAEQVDTILNGLVIYPRMDHLSDKILAALAESWPEKVLEHFERRAQFEKTAAAGPTYEPMPFKFSYLTKPLSNVPGDLVQALRNWYHSVDRDVFYPCERLLAMVFPGFPKNVEDELRDVIGSGERRDVEFVLHLLMHYDGEALLDPLLQDIVAELAADDSLLSTVEVILQSTGEVFGEFGFVEAYKRRKEGVQLWLSDPRENVRAFAERLLRTLDRQIAMEQRRSEERLELRKHKYGDEDSHDDQ